MLDRVGGMGVRSASMREPLCSSPIAVSSQSRLVSVSKRLAACSDVGKVREADSGRAERRLQVVGWCRKRELESRVQVPLWYGSDSPDWSRLGFGGGG